jgi:hypothetical protein
MSGETEIDGEEGREKRGNREKKREEGREGRGKKEKGEEREEKRVSEWEEGREERGREGRVFFVFCFLFFCYEQRTQHRKEEQTNDLQHILKKNMQLTDGTPNNPTLNNRVLKIWQNEVPPLPHISH